MALPQEILDDITRAKAFLSDRNVEHLKDLENGCKNCHHNNLCLSLYIRQLEKFTDYDDTAKAIHDKMMLIVGDYVILFKPQVSAGMNKVTQAGESISFNAVITPGSAAITIIQWTQVFGPSSATLSGVNTADLTASDLEVGDYIFQVEVTDANGARAIDQVVLTVNQSTVTSRPYTTPRGKYSTASSTVVDQYSIIIEELIGADLTFFVAHRGVSQTFGGSSAAADDNNVQVDVITGKVTFKVIFNDPEFAETLWFEYYKSTGGGPVNPGNNDYVLDWVEDGYFQ